MKTLLVAPNIYYPTIAQGLVTQYPDDIKIIGNNPLAWNMVMHEHDQELPDIVIVFVGIPGTIDPERFTPKTMSDAIRHIRENNPKCKIILLTLGLTIKDIDRNNLSINRISVVDGEPPKITSIAKELGLAVLPDFSHPILASYSLKGGVGKSSIAANLAVRLATAYLPPYDFYSGYLQRPTTGLKVLLWDMDFQSSDARIVFNVPSTQNIYTMLKDNPGGSLNLPTITKYIYSHPTGVDIFAAPPHNVKIKGINESDVADAMIVSFIKAFSQIYHVIIFDLPNEILTRPVVESALRSSTHVLNITQPNKRALKATQEGTYWLTKINKKKEDIYFILNRLFDQNVHTKQLEEVIGAKFSGLLPDVKGFDILQDNGDFPALHHKAYINALDELILNILPIFRKQKQTEPVFSLDIFKKPKTMEKR